MEQYKYGYSYMSFVSFMNNQTYGYAEFVAGPTLTSEDMAFFAEKVKTSLKEKWNTTSDVVVPLNVIRLEEYKEEDN